MTDQHERDCQNQCSLEIDSPLNSRRNDSPNGKAERSK